MAKIKITIQSIFKITKTIRAITIKLVEISIIKILRQLIAKKIQVKIPTITINIRVIRKITILTIKIQRIVILLQLLQLRVLQRTIRLVITKPANIIR